LCTNNGRYCAIDPDSDLNEGISGADVVGESLRRLCVWKHYGEDDGIGVPYWDYLSEFQYRCDNEKYFSSSDCIRDVYKKSNIDGDRIDRCMRDSGGVDPEEDSINNMLDAELKEQISRGVVVLPTAFVNTVALRGALTISTVFHGICAGYLEGTQPKLCSQCAGCNDLLNCVDDGFCDIAPTEPNAVKKFEKRHSSGVSKKTFGLTLLFITLTFGAAGFLHWKKTRDDMREQVRGILAEYMPLEESGEQVDAGSPMDFAHRGGKASLIT